MSDNKRIEADEVSSSSGTKPEPIRKKPRVVGPDFTHGDALQKEKEGQPPHDQEEDQMPPKTLSVTDRSSMSSSPSEPAENASGGSAKNDSSDSRDSSAETKDELLRAKERLRCSNKTVGLLSDRLEEAQRELKALKETTDENSVVQQELSKTKNQLRSSQKTVALLTDSLEEAQQRVMELTSAGRGESSRSETKLRGALQTTGEELAALKALMECSASPPTRDKLVAVIKNIQNTQEELRTVFDSSKSSSAEQGNDGTIRELTLAKNQLSEALTESNKKLEAAQSRLEQMEKSAESRQVSLSESESMLRSTNKTVSLLTRSLDEARTELAALRASSSSNGDTTVTSNTAGGQPSAVGGVQDAGGTSADPDEIVVESEELSLEVAGRVIGKGGEVVRDLQARSGAKMDVSQSLKPGHPRRIAYKGPRTKVEFARKLVQMIAAGVSDSDLPLGEAKRAVLTIPSARIGKVIGRGGTIVREMQSRSYAKIDFGHGSTTLTGTEEQNVVVVTGTEGAVAKAKEMILFIVANPEMDAIQLLNVLVDEKLRGCSRWGSGPPYDNLPNQGSRMRLDMFDKARKSHGRSFDTPHVQSDVPNDLSSSYVLQTDPSQSCDMMYCKRNVVGRIIGSKGKTVQALQERSGTIIHIKQDVPIGSDCEVNIMGTSEGVAMAKHMIQQIIGGGADHLFGMGRIVLPVADGSAMEPIVSRPTDRPTRWHDRQAQPSPPSSTDDGEWRRMTSPSGQHYYWNQKTGATQWEKPPC